MHVNKFLTSLAASAVLGLAAGSAHADTYTFDLSGPSLDATWELSDPVTVSTGVTGSYQVDDVQVSFSGAPAQSTLIDFLDSTYGSTPFTGPGIFLQNEEFFANGAQIFTVGNGTITFTPSTYTLTQAITNDSYLLTVTAVPEPTNVALLLGGLGLFGTMAARRRNAK